MPETDSVARERQADSPARLRLAPGLGLIFDLDGSRPRTPCPFTNVPGVSTWLRWESDAGDILARMHGRRNDEIIRDYLGDKAGQDTIAAHGAAKRKSGSFVTCCAPISAKTWCPESRLGWNTF